MDLTSLPAFRDFVLGPQPQSPIRTPAQATGPMMVDEYGTPAQATGPMLVDEYGTPFMAAFDAAPAEVPFSLPAPKKATNSGARKVAAAPTTAAVTPISNRMPEPVALPPIAESAPAVAAPMRATFQLPSGPEQPSRYGFTPVEVQAPPCMPGMPCWSGEPGALQIQAAANAAGRNFFNGGAVPAYLARAISDTITNTNTSTLKQRASESQVAADSVIDQPGFQDTFNSLVNNYGFSPTEAFAVARAQALSLADAARSGALSAAVNPAQAGAARSARLASVTGTPQTYTVPWQPSLQSSNANEFTVLLPDGQTVTLPIGDIEDNGSPVAQIAAIREFLLGNNTDVTKLDPFFNSNRLSDKQALAERVAELRAAQMKAQQDIARARIAASASNSAANREAAAKRQQISINAQKERANAKRLSVAAPAAFPSVLSR